MTLGISDLPLRTEVSETIRAAAQDSLTMRRVYPAGLPELRASLASHYTTAYGAEVSARNILIDAGTSSLFRSLMQIIAQPGDDIIIPLPYYPLYRVSAALAGCNCRYYPINLETGRVDIQSIQPHMGPRTRALVVNSPGNPLGNIVSSEELSAIVAVLPASAYIVIDEIYDNMRFDASQHPLAAPLFHDVAQRARAIVTNSVSKGYRMYTRRVGWAILPDPLVEPFVIVQQHTRLTVDPTVQLGVIEALKYADDVVAVCEAHKRRWAYTVRHLSCIPDIRLIPSQGGFYCTLDCRAFMKRNRFATCLALAHDILDNANVAVVPGADFGLPGTLRISFTDERYFEAIDRLCSYFTDASKDKRA
ncbi:MAG: aminotransferase class I/II-fold pyridoxal phosphate-dependent enzyme [Dehalococcoidia bacterium]|nr:aminotransferase class I/II-fold pyridoxal phosphate-dependent enzyme [Dehalococcoidia bacterium]